MIKRDKEELKNLPRGTEVRIYKKGKRQLAENWVVAKNGLGYPSRKLITTGWYWKDINKAISFFVLSSEFDSAFDVSPEPDWTYQDDRLHHKGERLTVDEWAGTVKVVLDLLNENGVKP